MAVDVETRGGLKLGTPTPLFDSGLDVLLTQDQYAVTKDGERFLLPVRSTVDAAQSARMIVILNWFEELKRLVPTN